MGSGGPQGLQFVAFTAATLLLYTGWLVLSAYAGTARPPGSSFPCFLLGYVLAGACWVPLGYGVFDWSSREVGRAEVLLMAAAVAFGLAVVAGACHSSGALNSGAVGRFAAKLGYDPTNLGKNVGLVLVLLGVVLIVACTKRP